VFAPEVNGGLGMILPSLELTCIWMDVRAVLFRLVSLLTSCIFSVVLSGVGVSSFPGDEDETSAECRWRLRRGGEGRCQIRARCHIVGFGFGNAGVSQGLDSSPLCRL